jgi:hypothetical protein
MDEELERLLHEWKLQPAELERSFAALGVACIEVPLVGGDKRQTQGADGASPPCIEVADGLSGASG